MINSDRLKGTGVSLHVQVAPVGSEFLELGVEGGTVELTAADAAVIGVELLQTARLLGWDPRIEPIDDQAEQPA